MDNKVKDRLAHIVMTIILFSIIAFVISLIKGIPADISAVIYMALILVAGVLIVNLLTDIVGIKTGRKNRQIGNTLSFSIKLFGYIAVIAIALASFKIGLTSILLGGGFIGIVVGLAAQTSLSNFFSGIVLLFSRPFSIGDRVTINTWQYGMVAPSYPPKFFSEDFLIPGYTGIVEEMALTFTTLRLDNNVPIKLPNSVVLQASITLHTEKHQLVRVRYEVPGTIPVKVFMEKAKKRISGLSFVKGPVETFISETSFPNKTYIMSLTALCECQDPHAPKSAILIELIDLEKIMSGAKKKR